MGAGSYMILVYNCGCCETPEDFEPCRKARRLEDRMHDASLEVQSCASNASWLAQYPLTCDDAEYFDKEHSIIEQADKLARVAVELEHLYYKEIRSRKRASRAHRAIAHHITRQSERGEYRYVFLEDPPEDPGFDGS